MSKEEIKTGIIIATDPQRVAVRLAPATIGECGKTCHCSALSLSEGVPTGPQVWIDVPEAHQYQTGQPVKVLTSLPSPYIGIFMVFVLPIAALLTGALLGDDLAQYYGQQKYQNLISGSLGGAGFIFSILLALLFDRIYRHRHQAFTLIEHRGDEGCYWQMPCSEKGHNAR